MTRGKMRFSLHNNQYPDKWSAGIYVRLSDEDREKKNQMDLSQSIKNQTDYCRAYMELLNGSTEEKFALEEYKVYCEIKLAYLIQTRKAEYLQNRRL